MNLTPREKDKLLISVAAMVAERRLKRGVKLNYPEAVAHTRAESRGSPRWGKNSAERGDLGAALQTAWSAATAVSLGQ